MGAQYRESTWWFDQARRDGAAGKEQFPVVDLDGKAGTTLAQASVPALQARAVAKRYRGGVRALDGIDLDIPVGSITALVGPNGAGKSTLMKAWVGFERPSRGTVTVLGIDPWRDRAAALDRLGYVSQRPALYRGLNVRDHVALAVSLRSGFDARASERHLAQLDIPLGQDSRTLSGGQQAQVMLALALGTRAPVLVLDEPLASLDPLARREFLHVLVDAVRAQGATAVLSSHVITDIEQACDRIVVLGTGHKILDESIAAALAAHRVVAGDPPGAPGCIRVAAFPGPLGELMTLWRLDDDRVDPPGFRPASLEELVIGRLASSRRPRTATADEAA
jgi:ABC-2 type transport system ATP-binding protein